MNEGFGGFCRFEVSQAPEVERKLMEELDAAGLLVTAARPNPRDLEYADLAKLPYLAAVMKASTSTLSSLSPISARLCTFLH